MGYNRVRQKWPDAFSTIGIYIYVMSNKNKTKAFLSTTHSLSEDMDLLLYQICLINLHSLVDDHFIWIHLYISP